MPKKAARKTTATRKKKPVTRRRTAKPAAKSYDSQIWTPLTGNPGGYSDVFGSQPEPKSVDLVNAYEDVVYACVRFISHQIGKHAQHVKLCCATGAGDARPKSATKALSHAQHKHAQERYAKFARRASRVEEVVDHPLLELLDFPNPKHSFSSLLALADVYLELTGSAFLLKARNTFGVVKELWLLETQYVTVETNENGAVVGYRYTKGDEELTYLPCDMIHVQFFDPANPYGGLGRSPLRAVWQRVQLLREEQSAWQALLTNMSYPSAIIFPPAELDGTGTFTPDQATRLSRQISERFRFGNQGGPFVVTERFDWQALSTPPKNQQALDMYAQIKEAICSAYPVPKSLIDGNYTSADADTVKRAFQETSLQPRIDLILDALTHQLVRAESQHVADLLGEPLSSSRRLFLYVEDVVSPDRAYDLQHKASTGTLFAGNLLTQNEGREALGLPPVDGGERFINQITATSQGVPSLPNAVFGRSAKPHTKGLYRPQPPNPKPLAEALRRVFRRMGEGVLSKLKTTNPTTKAFVPATDWTDDMRRELTPILRAYLDEGASAVFAAIGGDTALPVLPVQQLDKAVSQAVLALAESTHATTELSVTEAVAELREQLRQGLGEGEANLQLRERIEGIFTELSERRVFMIAESESSRAKHAGELIAIKDSGIDARKKWLGDSRKCELCSSLQARGAIPIDEPFGVVGTGPYSVIQHPPAHCSCRCSMQWELGE